MSRKTMSIVFKKLDENKIDDFRNQIERLERLILLDESDLEAKESKHNSSQKKLEDNEIDLHLEDVYQLEKFKDALRAQMLVSICGYFEYAMKRAVQNYRPNYFKVDDGLSVVINALGNSKLGIISRKESNSLSEYKAIRNICVHSNSHSSDKNTKIADAEKYTKGVKISPALKDPAPGKGGIILEGNFLPEALHLHSSIILKVHHFLHKNMA